ncbi:MAG: AMP-dependent Acyl-CoA synthetase and ligase [Cryptosporangiaceae bacterium]|nr:AMP-dependent Acyl-CoA synthetase and ligase [Cryptosporangiaceae bacterium]
MSGYDERPWLARYREGQPSDFMPDHGNGLSMYRASVEAAPHAPALHYFDGTLTFAELDSASDAFATALLDRGFTAGERVALYLQNVPQFVIALVGAWKAGGIAVLINPMSRQRELTYQLGDSGATVLVCLESLYGSVAREVESNVRLVVTTSELEYQTRHDPRLFGGVGRERHEGTEDLAELLAAHAGRRPPAVAPAPDDIAFLTYTSGTTGTPKGAMNTHGNVAFTAQVYRDWMSLGPSDVVLGVAPLFHITGAIGHVAVALLTGIPLVLAYRFDPGVLLDVLRDRRPTFTVGAITAFIALLHAPGAVRDDWSSLRVVYSGGAPISPSTAASFLAATGVYIHNIYGLTETTSPSHAVPLGTEAPVDPRSGALSVGVPVPGTVVRIIGEDGADLPPGEVGEIVTSGPQVVAGYWGKPEETAHAIPAGRLHTGDVGFMDSEGWFYIVDRKKDLINASGYKVWPREVEDVLYEHAAVREAAVVGVPDPYRGETVKAFVSLRPGAEASPAELIAFARERMAAYKYPRSVVIVEELPKTVTGKILRRELRTREEQ